MTLDVLFLTWNRLEFTKRALDALIANTAWEDVRSVRWYDDNSGDGTRRWMGGQFDRIPVPVYPVVTRELRSPVRTMIQFLAEPDPPDVFAKIDSDILVPPGWLPRMRSVMQRFPEIELLGMEAGMSGMRPPGDPLAIAPESYSWVDSSHIGGVGLMKTEAFLSRKAMKPMGRFGFTEWQHTYRPVRGWIAPDLLVLDMSRMPGQPWEHLSWEYHAKGWQRAWPVARDMDPIYWEWMEAAA